MPTSGFEQYEIVAELRAGIPINFEQEALQVITDSSIGSSELLVVCLHSDTGHMLTEVTIEFNSPPTYRDTKYHTSASIMDIHFDSNSMIVWTFTLLNRTLNIYKNGILGAAIDLGSEELQTTIFVTLGTEDSASKLFKIIPISESMVWAPVQRGSFLPYEMSTEFLTESLTVQTTTQYGTILILFSFEDLPSSEVGGISVNLAHPPTYMVEKCSEQIPFLLGIPGDDEKIWEFKRTSKYDLSISCNGELLQNIHLNDELCSEKDWRKYWEKDVKYISFSSLDISSSRFKRPIAGNNYFYKYSVNFSINRTIYYIVD